jgi:hypothetical protein
MGMKDAIQLHRRAGDEPLSQNGMLIIAFFTGALMMLVLDLMLTELTR